MSPSVRRLIATKMSGDAVAGGGVADAISFLSSPEKIKTGVAKATKWVKAAIQAVREASEPNPYRNADDETIAGVILQGIEERKASRHSVP
jgi:hypothetical protein